MFSNLYFQSARFRNFNWTDCLGRVSAVSGKHLLAEIREAYELGDFPDPCFVDTIRLTLRLETAARYLKRVRVPLVPRDFALSKLFQFLYEPLRIQGRLDEPERRRLRRQLEAWLDSLPKTALARLYRFDWPAFFDDTHRLDRSELLAGLDRYLPGVVRRKGPRAAWMGRRGPVPDLATYKPIRDAVAQVGRGWGRKAALQRLAGLLDDAGHPAPERWAELDPPVTSWRSAVRSHARLVRKHVSYRLERFQKLSKRARALREQARRAEQDDRA